MTLSNFYKELKQRNALLTYAGLANFIVLGIVIIISFFDHRTVLGINTWIKPMKFLLSVGIYLWTFAWILEDLNIRKGTRSAISWTLTLVMVIENSLVVLQGARGVRSHFNFSSTLDGAIFATMGILILVNTLVIFYVAILFFFRPGKLSLAYLWAIRLGLLLVLFASYEGSLMVDSRAHSVGVPDGGSGLPFLNWSTEGGDLRVAHFVGLHALQILPLFAFFLESRKIKQAVYWVVALAFLYACLALWVFTQAQAGIPLIAA